MTEHRVCTVHGVEGTCKFHGWGQRSYPIEPSIINGGSLGGQVSYPVAIVEKADGGVEVTIAENVRFMADNTKAKPEAQPADEPTKEEQKAIDLLCKRCALNDDPEISDEEADVICDDCLKRFEGAWKLTHFRSREVKKS